MYINCRSSRLCPLEYTLFDLGLRAVLNKSWKQHSTKQQLYGHLTPISKTTQVRTRHVGHCCRSKHKIISDVLVWIPSHGHASVGQPTITFLQQLCKNIGCRQEDRLEAMDDWCKRVRAAVQLGDD